METIVTWGAMSIGVAAVVFACHASYRVGVMKGIQNGMGETLKRIEGSIVEIFQRLGELPCKERGAEARERNRRLEVLEDKMKELT